MPCLDWIPNNHSSTIVVTDPTLKDKVDKLTRMLCSLLKEIENRNAFSYIPLTPELSDWWKEHKELDRKRIEEEKAKDRQKILDLETEIAKIRNKKYV